MNCASKVPLPLKCGNLSEGQEQSRIDEITFY
nr:MAG TPA_asm: hypothetical protein [Caudoviricetes sp.]